MKLLREILGYPLVLAALVLAGCSRNSGFSTHTVGDEQHFKFNFENGMGPMDHFVGEVVSYNLVWPDKGAISPAAGRELMFPCGIQAVTLPIFWLSKHVRLTPYAKGLFGPECYVE